MGMTDTVIPGHSCFLLCELPSSISSLLHHACLCCCNKLRPSSMVLGPCFLKICSANLFFFLSIGELNICIQRLLLKMKTHSVFLILLPLLYILCSFLSSCLLPLWFAVLVRSVSAIHGYSHLTCVYGGSYDPLVGKDFSKHFLEGWSSGDEFFPFLLVPHF